jgi:hypothetical protein
MAHHPQPLAHTPYFQLDYGYRIIRTSLGYSMRQHNELVVERAALPFHGGRMDYLRIL